MCNQMWNLLKQSQLGLFNLTTMLLHNSIRKLQAQANILVNQTKRCMTFCFQSKVFISSQMRNSSPF